MPAFTRDNVWVWDGAANNLGPSIYGLGEVTRFFRSENAVCMWLSSMTDRKAALAKLSGFKNVVWELTRSTWCRKSFKFDGDNTQQVGYFMEDSWSQKRGWESKEEALKISELSLQYPNIAGGILDYSFAGFDSRGGTPEDLKGIRDSLRKHNPALKLFWMNYTKDLDPKWLGYAPHVDVISLWESNTENLKNLENSVARCAELMPGKPILLGMYLVNYWSRRTTALEDNPLQWHPEWVMAPIPKDLMELQLTTAVRLVRQGRIVGFSVLAESMVDKFPETAEWVREFLEKKLHEE